MTTLTVWKNDAGEVRLNQLTDDHDAIVGYNTVKSEVNTGTEEDPVFEEHQVPVYGPVPYPDQIKHLATISFMAGFTCVSENYTGTAPETDPNLWRWDGTTITAVVPVPVSVTPRQVRLLLLQQGLLANVEAMIKAGDQATQITWEFASEFLRNDPLLEQLSKALGLTDAQVDQFFIAAASL
ncbi:hypothetical protein UFOVP143_6 [uncultured Caudovirales phage]|uniref:Uncharacterized protein n=1 Tax=uncultured Caudovirales phage TaxID=2100421 RepID=A0A6J7VJH9_9CAUD|nr:hypothetical protein UFOVP143_6 [uncultured Caudovirales phage]